MDPVECKRRNGSQSGKDSNQNKATRTEAENKKCQVSVTSTDPTYHTELLDENHAITQYYSAISKPCQLWR